MDMLAEHGGKTFIAIDLPSHGQFESPHAGTPYPCLIWDHGAHLTDEARSILAGALLDSGCRYAVCGGVDCQSWENAVDVEFLKRHVDDSEQQLDDSFVMTTSHQDEAPDDVAHFFVRNTNFDLHDFTHFIVLHIGDGPTRREVNAAVRKYATDGDAV